MSLPEAIHVALCDDGQCHAFACEEGDPDLPQVTALCGERPTRVSRGKDEDDFCEGCTAVVESWHAAGRGN